MGEFLKNKNKESNNQMQCINMPGFEQTNVANQEDKIRKLWIGTGYCWY